MSASADTSTFTARVDHVRRVSPTAYVVRFERHDLAFAPGQYVMVGREGGDVREYSLYSSPRDSFLDILVREVEGGQVSQQLSQCAPGDSLSVRGPRGEFVTPANRDTQRFLFVGTGTGIAPFHSILGSYPHLDYLLLHGVRDLADRFDRECYTSDRYVACLSRGEGGDWSGRVTTYLERHPVDPATLCYLCGSCDMIYDAFAILSAQGIPREQVRVETYY
jgi:ferredoxin--NADP+ reductase/benzoate/toluate 1,2-dioxygenase reductase subunit